MRDMILWYHELQKENTSVRLLTLRTYLRPQHPPFCTATVLNARDWVDHRWSGWVGQCRHPVGEVINSTQRLIKKKKKGCGISVPPFVTGHTHFVLQEICQFNCSKTVIWQPLDIAPPSLRPPNAWFQAYAVKQFRPAFFWDISQSVVVMPYRRFGATYWFRLQGSRNIRLFLESWRWDR